MVNKRLYALEVLILIVCIVGLSTFALLVFRPEISILSIGMWGSAVFVSTLTMYAIFAYEVYAQTFKNWIFGIVLLFNFITIFMVIVSALVLLCKAIFK